MEGRTELDLAIARSRIDERLDEASQARQARLTRTVGSRGPGRVRRWLGHALVGAGRSIARDGLVEGSGEPIAREASTVVIGRAPAPAAPPAEACTAACSELEPAA